MMNILFIREGRAVYKHAVTDMLTSSESVMARNGLSIDTIDYFIPHQANLRIIELLPSYKAAGRKNYWSIFKSTGIRVHRLSLCVWPNLSINSKKEINLSSRLLAQDLHGELFISFGDTTQNKFVEI